MATKIKIFAFFLVWMLSFCGNVVASGEVYDRYAIRVAIVQGEEKIRLSIRGAYQITDPRSGRLLYEGRRLLPADVGVSAQGVSIEDLVTGKDGVRIIADKDVTLYAAGRERSYRSQIDILPAEAGGMLVINTLGLEDYIRGVLYHEIDHRWPIEAIKAQAVAARTYALYQAKMNRKRLFDVSSDIYSQVYGGRTAERYRTNLAILRTYGEILTYQDEILPTYFHATCGGHTEDVEELWNHKDLIPLSGVPCQFCSISPHYRWRKNFRSQTIQELLNASGYRLGLIKSFEVSERNASDRIRTIEITTRDGKKETITGKKFRELIGPDNLKSNRYGFEMKGYYFDVVGSGWGHGVGLCQWGAYGMSLERYNHEEILRHYYPGARIVDHRALDVF